MSFRRIASSCLSRSRGFLEIRRFRSTHVNGYAIAQEVSPSSPFPPMTDEKGAKDGTFVQGEVLNLAADLRTFRPGDKLEIPYELTVTESMQEFWQSVRPFSSGETFVVLPKSNNLTFWYLGISCTGSHSYFPSLLSEDGIARSGLTFFLGLIFVFQHDS